MESAARRGDPLLGMETGWTADGDHVHRLVREEPFEIGVMGAAVLCRKGTHFFGVGSEYGGDAGIRSLGDGACVGSGDVSGADQPNMDGHLRTKSEVSVKEFRFSCEASLKSIKSVSRETTGRSTYRRFWTRRSKTLKASRNSASVGLDRPTHALDSGCASLWG